MFSRVEELGIKNLPINTVAKVASASFLHSLKDKYPKIHHGHSLFDMKNVIDHARDTLIISGIRNPLERNVSYFFQTFSDKFYNDVKILANNYKGEYCYVMSDDQMISTNPLELISIFMKQENHFTFNEWFYEFLTITNTIDEEFDKKNGIKIYNLPNNNYLLMYTFESLARNTLFINSFFGINKFLHSNNSSQRHYGSKYNMFKKLLSLEPDYKIRLLRTPIMKYFYSNEDIDKFFCKF